MEKKNYKFTAYDSKGKEIKLGSGNCIYECTNEQVGWLQLGILVGLMTKYKDPQVTFKEV